MFANIPLLYAVDTHLLQVFSFTEREIHYSSDDNTTCASVYVTFNVSCWRRRSPNNFAIFQSHATLLMCIGKNTIKMSIYSLLCLSRAHGCSPSMSNGLGIDID